MRVGMSWWIELKFILRFKILRICLFYKIFNQSVLKLLKIISQLIYNKE